MAAMAARSQTASLQRTELAPGDLYALFDGAAEGAHSQLEGAFMAAGAGAGMKPTMSTRTLQLIYDEEAVMRRSGRLDAFRFHGPANVKQVEKCLLIARDKPEMPTRSRKHFKGTNQGNAIAGVPLLDMDDMWQLPLAKKKEVLGKYRVPVMPAASSSSDGEGAAADFDDVEGDAKARPNKYISFMLNIGGCSRQYARARRLVPPPPPYFSGSAAACVPSRCSSTRSPASSQKRSSTWPTLAPSST